MDEQMVPGDYTALCVVNIRTQMKTTPVQNVVGAYTNGVPFRVYQVYDEKDGILWARVSSNTGDGRARYAALRVANNVKAKLEKAFSEPEENDENDIVRAINANTAALTGLTAAVRDLASKQG
jgi:hypothetical protein